MAHKVISLKYRPQNFDGLTGQNHVVLALKGAIKSGAIGHAFLFAGPRGVGKTTAARILAKSINCIEGPTVSPCQKCQSCGEITLSRSVDVIEIDGASNRGIDEIRDLREGVRYAPLHSRFKVYIIDEVHMLTPEAFNALLKTLEEPPSNVVFILATTNPTKIPDTIRSRCQRFTFKRLSTGELINRLKDVAAKEDIAITDDALHYLALRADGSVRDGESILEQLGAFVESEIKKEDVLKLIGLLGSSFYLEIVSNIARKDLTAVLTNFNKGVEDSADPLEVYRGLVSYLRNLLLHNAGLKDENLELTAEELGSLTQLALPMENVMNMIELCLRSEEVIRRSVNPRIAVELLLSQLTLMQPGSSDKATVPKKTEGLSTLKQALQDALAKKSPKLAGVLHKADIIQDEKTVIIKVDTEFLKKELANNQKVILEIVRRILDDDIVLDIRLGAQAKKEIDGMVETIKSMFDGEEIR